MRTIKMAKLPKCDLCKTNDAKYDAPTIYGSWAYICEDCSKTKSTPDQLAIGNELTQHTPAKPVDRIVNGVEKSTLREIVFDHGRHVACPECGCERHVEPDATYAFTCAECGVKVKCKAIM